MHPVPRRRPPPLSDTLFLSLFLTDCFTLDGEVCQPVSCGSLLFLHITRSNLILICNRVANVKLIYLKDPSTISSNQW